MHSIVLSRRDLKEFDQIITLYTLEQGKIEVLAKGVKKILSKNSSSLLEGNLIEAEVIQAKEIALWLSGAWALSINSCMSNKEIRRCMILSMIG